MTATPSSYRGRSGPGTSQRENFAQVGELGLQALDIEANRTLAGKRQRYCAGRRIALDEFDCKEIELRVFVRLIEIAAPAGNDAFESQRGSATSIIRRIAAFRVIGFNRIYPVEAIERHHESMLARLPEDIADFDKGVLHVGRNDLHVVLVEGNELEFLHGHVPAVGFSQVRN
jgi:hypothetical protein